MENIVGLYVMRRIRSLRIARGLSQRKMAKQSGIPEGSYSTLEAGRYKLNSDNLFRMLLALGAEITEVFPQWPEDILKPDVISQRVIVGILAEEAPALTTSIDEILEIVARHFRITVEEMCSGLAERQVISACMVAARLVNDDPNLKLADLARRLRKLSDTLNQAQVYLASLMERDQVLRLEVEGIEGELEQLWRSKLSS